MSFKPLISLWLATLLLGKVFAVDAQAITLISEGAVTVAKPQCRKRDAAVRKEGQPYQVARDKANPESRLNLSSYCTPQFHLESPGWEVLSLPPEPNVQQALADKLKYPFLDCKVPPPRYV